MAMGITNNFNNNFNSTYESIYEVHRQQAFKPQTPKPQESRTQPSKPQEPGSQAPKLQTSGRPVASKAETKEIAVTWKNGNVTADKGTYLNELSKLAPSVKQSFRKA